MSKNTEKYIEAAKKWDEGYRRFNNIIEIDNNAIRVEQGEYAVSGITKSIGTYNVRQCVAVHIINKNRDLHGLAHIDGHTEIKSLDKFLNDLGLNEFNKNGAEIRIIGASDSMVMGLNNKDENLAKTKEFLRSNFPTKDIDQLIAKRDTEHKDFVIDGQGQVKLALASGVYDSNRTLHVIQEVKRKDGYIGTYPIIRANDGHNTDKAIYLDERAIVKLTEYKNNLTKDITSREQYDTTDYSEYDEAIPIILKNWENAKKQVKVLVQNSQIPEETRNKAVDKMPIYIGEGAETKNQNIVTAINEAKTYSELNNIAVKENTATISQALDFCSSVDKDLNKNQVLADLTKKYNEKYQSTLSPSDVASKSYGAEISVQEFIDTVAARSPKLNGLMLLNSQGAAKVNENNPHYYTINEAKEAAQHLGSKQKQLLEQKIENYNNLVNQKPLEVDKVLLKEKIRQELKNKNFSLKKSHTLQIEQADNPYEKTKDILSAVYSKDEVFINEFIKAVEDSCKAFAQAERNEKELIKGTSRYGMVQSDFLQDAMTQGLISDFNDIRISTHLAKTAKKQQDQSFLRDQQQEQQFSGFQQNKDKQIIKQYEKIQEKSESRHPITKEELQALIKTVGFSEQKLKKSNLNDLAKELNYICQSLNKANHLPIQDIRNEYKAQEANIKPTSTPSLQSTKNQQIQK